MEGLTDFNAVLILKLIMVCAGLLLIMHLFFGTNKYDKYS